MVCLLVGMEGPAILIGVPESAQPAAGLMCPLATAPVTRKAACVSGDASTAVDPMRSVASRSAARETGIPGNSSMTSWMAPRITSVMSP